ncbi:uncharacterized protein LOC107619971 [Arachis ipaensis]|uniref:uncharacterized protein LOC107619971 n=1 Tax=Arachis ipaensis TaxID=130454 RepID=UPI0007AF5474|nr:uncharacterized protein LOC107619971 [Arachis ipaensis]
MVSDENFVALVYNRGSIKKKTRSDIKFTNKDPLSVFLKPSTSFTEFKNTMLQKLGLLGVKRVEKLFYRIPISVLHDDVKYDSFVISSDEDFSGGSNWNPQSLRHLACSNSMPIGASSVAPIVAPEAVVVASPSFAFNLNRSGDAGVSETGPSGEVAFATPGSSAVVPVFGDVGVPDGVEDALHDDGDVEPAIIANDSDDDTPRLNPVVGGGASSSDKEEVVLSVKTYSICRGIEYKVLESDHRKYYGKCKEFGSGCTWLIRVSLRQRRGIWEVKRYNIPHTCLATSISSDHRKLDYHIISAFILPMIQGTAECHGGTLRVQIDLQEGLDG